MRFYSQINGWLLHMFIYTDSHNKERGRNFLFIHLDVNTCAPTVYEVLAKHWGDRRGCRRDALGLHSTHHLAGGWSDDKAGCHICQERNMSVSPSPSLALSSSC